VFENTLIIVRKKTAGLSEAALDRFVRRARKAARMKNRVNVLVTNSAEMRSLNRRFRGKNKATDVLSFPSAVPAQGKEARLAGEIAVSAEIATQNAYRLGHPVADEVKILVLHGILHLAGFDHESDNGQMARRELELRQRLRLPTGLIERAVARRSANNPEQKSLLPRARKTV
jgi:probable rRNA maturation factor